MIKIDESLQSLIPPLSDSERQQLEASILAEGIRDPLVVWGDILVDGHHRYKVAQKHDLQYETIQRDFDSVVAAKVWMIRAALGKRNLTDGWKFELEQTKRDLLRVKGQEKYAETVGRPPKESLSLNDNDKPEKHNTQKAIAADLGWSNGKTAQAEQASRNALAAGIRQSRADP